MKARALVLLAAMLAGLASLPATADPLPTDRYVPGNPGEIRDLTYLFGPFEVPPGHDRNLATLDLPVYDGFIISVAPNLVDAVTGLEPTEQQAHIHHAHWLRITADSGQYHPYSTGLSWVFGTGEEKTQGSLLDRAARDSDGRVYGIPIDGTTPQTLIFMIHNKLSSPLHAYITLEVKFMYGDLDQLAARGINMHPLTGVLWGQTTDVHRASRGWIDDMDTTRNRTRFTVPWDGTIVASAGHMHPGGRKVVVANLGPERRCGYVGGVPSPNPADFIDPDADGYPGVTILNSYKLDRVPGAAGLSEDYQMGASKFGWRAPIHRDDVLAQFGVYDVDENSWYEAMSYTGIYVDKLEKPAPLPAGNPCPTGPTDLVGLARFQPKLLGADTLEAQGGIFQSWYRDGATEGLLNHVPGPPDKLCGIPGTQFAQPCDTGPAWRFGGEQVSEIHVAGFTYTPGDLRATAPIGLVPRVKLGSTLRLLNDDVALGVRHTFTSCEAPCNGEYVANYPLPTGRFDSGKLGNLDYVDGGLTSDETRPFYELAVDGQPWLGQARFVAGTTYPYFCMIHPWMRGAFEVVA